MSIVSINIDSVLAQNLNFAARKFFADVNIIWPVRRLGFIIMLKLDSFKFAGFILFTYRVI